jgi:hypothetical protein
MAAGRTLVFCTSYFEGAQAWNGRLRKWLRHHAALPWQQRPLLCLIDDGSPVPPPADEVTPVAAGQALPDSDGRPLFVRFDTHLGRAGLLDYPGWWRSFLHAAEVARQGGCDKIVHIESDAFVLSRRMLQFLESRTRGWTAFWCPRWKLPETSIQVICADQFAALERLRQQGFSHLAGRYAERELPFTEVVHEPFGNRYGEFRHRVPGYADFAAQLQPGHAVWFR